MTTTEFSPQAFYFDHTESLRLQLSSSEKVWLDRHDSARSAETLLVFGCGVQLTPHLMREAVSVFDLLGLDSVAVAHQQFCCGRPLRRVGNEVAADRIVEASYRRFADYRPSVTVQWCAACMITFHDVVEDRAESRPFDVVHVSRFVADLLAEKGSSVPWTEAPTRRVLLHQHAQVTKTGVEMTGPDKINRVAHPSVVRILEAIPNVELAGLVEPPSLGLPCELTTPGGPWTLDSIDDDQYRSIQDELRAQLADAQADTIVTPFHACQRNWSKLGGPRLHVRHWMSMLAEALGVGVEDRFQKLWRLQDPEAAADLARPQWESWGITRAEAVETARKHFMASYAGVVAECECGGSGCGPDEPPVLLSIGAQGP